MLSICHLALSSIVGLGVSLKMNLMKKTCWFKDGQRTHDPDTSAYVGALSRQCVRIAATYAALNEINLLVSAMVMSTCKLVLLRSI